MSPAGCSPPGTSSGSGTSAWPSSATARTLAWASSRASGGATGTGRRSTPRASPVAPELQRLGPHGRAVAHRLTRELLSLDDPPTAIFAASDTQALGVLEAARVEGFDVPGDLSVVGFDDLELAPYVGLTTVHQPLAESGRRAVERLGRCAGGGAAPGGAARLRLEVRGTTAPPR